VFSPIRFQADMGILLAFMFLFNMLGALILLPALAHFLLTPSQRAQPDNSNAVMQDQNGKHLDVKLNQRLTEGHNHA
jgi:multidrug efflux pump subunit AcrB